MRNSILRPSSQGAIAALIAYVAWGLFPIYFKKITAVEPVDVIAWRIVLCFVLMLAVFMVWQGLAKFVKQLKAVNQWGLLVSSAVLLSANWLVFVYAIKSNQVLQSSLGYFLVPIISVGLGVLIFREKPNRYKILAVVIASAGMVITFVVAGVLPWVSIALGGTFGVYGMLRKKANYDSAIGLFMETAVLLPVAIGYIVFWAEPITSFDTQTQFWVYLLGVVTALPLLTMIFAARRIELSSLGFFQYITPCMHLLLAVAVYNESIDLPRLIVLSTTLVAVGFWLFGSLPRLTLGKPKAS